MGEVVFKLDSGEDVSIFAAHGENLLDLIRKAGVMLDAPCSGNGSCGKCRVRLLEGSVVCGGGAGRHVSGDDLAAGWRLACDSTVDGDASFLVPDTLAAYMGRIQATGVPQPTLISTLSSLRSELSAAGVRFDDVNDGRPGATGPIYGLAIDVGTTTVSGLLVDMHTGAVISAANMGNAQIRYGADVINRIIEQQKPGGVARLQQAIVNDTLLPLVDGLRKAAGTPGGVGRGSIARVTIASNTTMNHLLLGVDANPLRMEPYVPQFLVREPFDPSTIGINLAPEARVVLAPNIGSYVGGDITAGTLASMMWDRPEMSLLIDLGTNGEIVFGNNEFLMACACSAGPAFEGGDISCGMRAADGAIEACIIDEKTMAPELVVIGGGKPAGLCGSGLIDVVAGLFRSGAINGKGRLNDVGGRVRRDAYGIGNYILVNACDSSTGREITISEVDIDNFIRAKGAIFSAVISMLAPLGLAPEDIGSIMIAGGIGSGINIKNAISVGMLPDVPESHYSYIGNSALSGAYAALVSRDAERRLREIADAMTYIELSSQPGYMDAFVAACFLPHTDETLFPSVRG